MGVALPYACNSFWLEVAKQILSGTVRRLDAGPKIHCMNHLVAVTWKEVCKLF